MDVIAAEVQSITSTGMVIGDDTNNRAIRVVGVQKANSNTITMTLSLVATVDDSNIIFDLTSSTFHTLAAQADNGIIVELDVTATTGAMYLDGDYDNSSSTDSTNTVGFTDGKVITAETTMTLEATAGSIPLAGILTLTAGSGVVLLDSMTSGANGKSLVIDADFESEGDGTLTVWTGKTVTTTTSDITITAWDLDMSGSMTTTTGDKTVSIHGSKDAQTIGIIGLSSSVNRDMQISTAELQRITATGAQHEQHLYQHQQYHHTALLTSNTLILRNCLFRTSCNRIGL